MHWVVYATAASGGIALFNIASRMLAGKIQPSFAAMVMGLSIFVTLTAYHFITQGNESFSSEWSNSGMLWAVIAGFATCIINLAMFYAFTNGAPITIAPAYVNVLAIFVTVLLGAFLFREGINLTKGAGLGCACISIYLLMKG